ncbi:hypothetical protein GF312_08380 [Candidatus Poribacteria bacterium]|nr:hypothetical protein [Candidatus Poribacteria bacterium]
MRNVYVLMFLFVLFFTSVFNSYAQVDPEIIVGLWTLDEGEGDVAGDSSENARDGNITGAEWEDGQFGDALNFEKGDTVEVLLGDGIITDKLTIILWLNFTDLAGQQNYFSIWDSSDKRYVPYKTDTNELRFWTNNWDAGTGFNVEEDTWYHVANVYDGQTGSIYVNGELTGSMPGAFALSENQQSSWFATDKGGWLSSCMEDEIGIFSDALTEGQIKSIMEHGIIWALGGAAVSSETKLAATWAAIK